MRGRSRVLLAMGLGLWSAAGCQAFLSFEPEGSGTSSDAGAADAPSVEASMADGPRAGDGAPVVPFACPTGTTMLSVRHSFEAGEASPQTVGTVLAVDVNDAPDGLRVARASGAALEGSSALEVRFDTVRWSSISAARVSAWYRVQELQRGSSTDAIHLLSLQGLSSDGEEHADIALARSGGASLVACVKPLVPSATCEPTFLGMSVNHPKGEWHRVSLQLDQGVSGGVDVSWSFDGKPVLAPERMSRPSTSERSVRAFFGIVYRSAAGGHDVEVDFDEAEVILCTTPR